MTNKPLNAAFSSYGLFFQPAYMQMKPAGNGPAHVFTAPGCVVTEDGMVTFNFKAPAAQTVAVSGNGGGFSNEKVPLVKGEDGLWSVTIKMNPGFHYVRFWVDGVNVTNSQMPYSYGCHENINFVDVPADAPYAKAVAWAVEKGITNGTSDTTFSPVQTCTRGHIVTFLYREKVEPAADN